MNIILTGYRCTGKTSVGRRLAARLGRPFYNTDDFIVKRAGKTIEEIVAAGGWPAFREAERAVIKDFSGMYGSIISPGGGAFLDERNVADMKKNGLFVWLVADAATIARRLEKDRAGGASRPSLTGKPVEQEVREVLAEREPLYRRIADLTVDTSARTVEEVATTIIRALEKETLPRWAASLAAGPSA